MAAYNKAYYSKETRRRYQHKHMYGLTGPEFQALLNRQDGKCAICDTPMATPHVDHCHATGAVRGLLCKLCNAGLGQFKDDTARLQRAVEYLTNSRRV